MQIALVVYANPYAALDHLARPQAFVKIPGTNTVIGGEFDHEAHEASKKDSISGEGKNVYKFNFDPQPLTCRTINDLAYYTRAIADGALIAGDEATAKRAGVEFVEPVKALEAAKAKAAADWAAAYGAPPDWAATPAPKATPKASAKLADAKES